MKRRVCSVSIICYRTLCAQTRESGMFDATHLVRFWHKADITRLSSNVRFWGYGTHILILQAFSTLPLGYPTPNWYPRRFPAA